LNLLEVTENKKFDAGFVASLTRLNPLGSNL